MAAVTTAIETPTERLEAEVCTLAAQLAAATCRFGLLVAELDRREAWKEWGCRSMAYWLSYRCGVSISTAREQVRVGLALDELPVITETFASGALSYSKVRALVRVATPETEADLVELGQVSTAAQLERVIGVLVGTSRTAAESQLDRRAVRWHPEGDGSLTVTTRLTADVGTVFVTNVEHALAEVPSDASADAHDPISARRADAFELIMRSYGTGDPVSTSTAEVVVHADLAMLCDTEGGEPLRMLACDAGLVLHVEDQGRTPDVGRRTRRPPSAVRRALHRRDGGTCRFPGCTNRRFVHAHHIDHWAHGGATTADNLVLLCTFHHRLVHLGFWRVRGRADAELVFTAPNGRTVAEQPRPLSGKGSLPGPSVDATTIATAEGGRLDLDCAVTALVSRFPTHPN